MTNRLLPLFWALLLTTQCFATQTDISGPLGSGGFGTNITILPNGNFVVTDPLFDQLSPPVADVGAVYLYSPEGALISTLQGSTAADQVGKNGVAVLKTGHFLVISQSWDKTGAADAGAVTWGNGATGFGAALVVVSAANSLVGNSANDHVGSFVTNLTNGNYVILSHEWDNTAPTAIDAGATTWGNGYTGTVGVVSSSNSLVGTTAGDALISFVTALTNGNYVVSNGAWDNGAENVGAVTWGNGATGVKGVISAANSLVGTSGFDSVGNTQVVALANGNYVVGSPYWSNTSPAVAQAGAVTWGNGKGGSVGAVSAANSIVGGTDSDSVGSGGITVLTNGNYVVGSPLWDKPSPATMDVGAVTWGNGRTGTAGIVSAADSLIGSTADDNLSDGGGVMPLANGNYLVLCQNWDNGALVDAGSATWGNGAVGVSGTVGPSNSLIGGSANDRVGGNALALTNGNYVVISALWNNPSPAVVQAGAATWGNGRTGVKGLISIANSLVGTSANDIVGGAGGVALSNGNYVIASDRWDSADVGAVTWGNGSTGIKGAVSAANSLVGTHGGDNIGRVGVTALPNGNFVILSSNWDNAVPNVGAVTWGNGTTGIKGPVTPANSLVGTSTDDFIGDSEIKILPNSNYLVRSPMWNNTTTSVIDAGAVTWGNGSTGVSGPITMANSITGVILSDQVGKKGLFTFSDSSYVILSPDVNNPLPATLDAGAVTLGDGATGTTGLVSPANSVLGTAPYGGINLEFGFDPARRQMIVGRKNSNLVTVFAGGQLRSLAKTSLDAPGAPDIAYSTPGTTAVDADGGLLADYTLIGAGSARGKNRAIFSAPSTRGPLDLVLQTGDVLSTLRGGLPPNAKATALTSQITQQARRGVFQTTISGTGITTNNNLLLMMDNGVGVSLLHRTGQAISGLSNATAAKFVEVLQSHDRDLITVSYRLKTSTTPVVTTSTDTGLLLLDHAGAIGANLAAREGASVAAFASSGTFGQFTGRAAAGQGSTIHFGALFTPTIGLSVTGIFRMTSDGVTKATTAAVGSPAPGAGANFASFPALSSIGSDALFKATLTGAAAINEGLWRGPATLLLRKGDAVDAVNLPGVKFGSILRFWPAGSTQVIVQVALTGTGVSAKNNQALVLRQADGAYLVLLRTGHAAPGCGPAKVLAISAVDVNPVTGRYVVLGTLSGALATANQALWSGNPALGDDTTSQILRQPVLRLRKGQNYTTENTPQSTVRSITLRPAIDATGAGGRGLAQCIGSSGDIAVYMLGDRGLTELVMLPP